MYVPNIGRSPGTGNQGPDFSVNDISLPANDNELTKASFPHFLSLHRVNSIIRNTRLSPVPVHFPAGHTGLYYYKENKERIQGNAEQDAGAG